MSHSSRTVVCALASLLLAGALQSRGEARRLSYEERRLAQEKRFFAAAKAGKNVTGVLVEGNSLFNGTTSPQKSYAKPYSKEELRAAKISAERNSKVFLLARDGTLYYPTVKRGVRVSESQNSPRIPRVLTAAQRRGPKLTKWASLVPLVGREVEVCGEIYNGYGGVKGIHIELIRFEGQYIVDEN